MAGSGTGNIDVRDGILLFAGKLVAERGACCGVWKGSWAIGFDDNETNISSDLSGANSDALPNAIFSDDPGRSIGRESNIVGSTAGGCKCEVKFGDTARGSLEAEPFVVWGR